MAATGKTGKTGVTGVTSAGLARPAHAAAVYQVEADERVAVARRHAHVLLEERLLVRAALADEVEILVLVHLLALVVGRQLRLELVEEALVKRVAQRDPVEREVLRVAAVLDLLDERLEVVRLAARRREDLQLPAPRDARVGDAVEEAQVRVQRRLVDDAVAALASLGVRVRRERVDV